MKKYIFCLLPILSYAQNNSMIRGVVIDSTSREALSYATVYLGRTTIGAYSKEDGSFALQGITEGKYLLVVSMLGYATKTIPVVINQNKLKDFQIQLVHQSVTLDSVTIVAKRLKQNLSDYFTFEKYFLGETKNSRLCRILNRQDIVTYRERNRLVAFAKKPIVIENKALGYKIFYELKEFGVDYFHKQVTLSGIPRFEELTPANERQLARWKKERDRAFNGSAEHFLTSLKTKKLRSNYFSITDSNGAELLADSLIKEDKILYTGKLTVSFLGEAPEDNYSEDGSYGKKYSQLSEIEFDGVPVTVYENGNFEEFHHLRFNGYFSWAGKVAELLPLGYKPTTQKD